MALLTTAASPVPAATLRNVSAQATTGQTDWVVCPSWATQLVVTLNITANAGTTPTTTLTLREPDPVTLDDTNDHSVLLTSAVITAASFHTYAIGPGMGTDSADSTTADAYQNEDRHIPAVIGIRVLNDRTTGDETYTYTLTYRFK